MRHNGHDRDSIAHDVAHLGVTEACRSHGIHRSTWYRWEAAPSGVPPPSTRTSVHEAIARLACEYPTWGCDRIAYFLSFDHMKVSSPTVQKILIELGLGRKEQRLEHARLRSLHPSG